MPPSYKTWLLGNMKVGKEADEERELLMFFMYEMITFFLFKCW